ncbi:MAG: hypothetical protein JO121_17705 [Deltaproteobacteria bacterium]|jgi:hypothetical protein|nr:hypothetical protein [Deltaproteobacteria bacterium]
MNHKRLLLSLLIMLLIHTSASWGSETDGRGITVEGAGTSILTGGGPGTAPVITRVGINFENGSGHFDCLALMPTAPAGTPGSGSFDNNIMYVTGPISAASLQGDSVVLTGTATVTGVGAGTNLPFTVTADRGGPGTKVVLAVSGMTFVETLLEGSITFPGGN